MLYFCLRNIQVDATYILIDRMRFKNYIIISFMLMAPVTTMQAQFDKGLHYQIETSATLSGGEHTPFWLVANKHGLSSIRKNNAYLDAGIFRDLEKDKDFSYGFGLEMVGASRFTSKFFIQQAYADLRYHWLELSIGSKERGSELKNDQLSSGGMTFSTNARPIPQVRISIPEYTPVPFTKQWLHVKGHIAYGKFTDDKFQERFTDGRSKFTKETFYHSKAAFLKVENEKTPLSVELGIEMAAQFGGDCYFPDGTVIRTPNKFKDFLKVFIPSGGGSDASESDQINILGNHLGSYTAAVGYRFPTWKVKAYYEHFFEDRSGMVFTYGMWKDALIGLEVTLPQNRYVTSVVGEYIHTKHQSGAFHYLDGFDKPFTGADNYYNNGQYAGWEHWGMGLGNPLLTAPIYNSDGDLSFKSNRVKGFHLGLNGSPTSEIDYRILVSVVKHWGTYGAPFQTIRRNHNGLLEVTYKPQQLNGWSFALAGAADGGDMLGNSWGGMLTIRKTGLIGKNR